MKKVHILAIYYQSYVDTTKFKKLSIDSIKECDLYCIERLIITKGMQSEDMFISGNKAVIVTDRVDRQDNMQFIEISDVMDHLKEINISKLLNRYYLVLRNYVETFNVTLVDKNKMCKFSYVVLGDTHHMPDCFRHAYKVIQILKPDLITSLANPNHLNAFKYFDIPMMEYPAYGFNQLEAIKKTIKAIDCMNKTNIVTSCGRLTRIQTGRCRLIKTVMNDRLLCNQIYLYDYKQDISEYYSILRSGYYSLIASLNGQFSPQIQSSLICGSIPIIDNLNIFGETDSHQITKDACISREEYNSLCNKNNLLDLYRSKTINLYSWLLKAIDHFVSYRSEEVYFLEKFEHIKNNYFCKRENNTKISELNKAIKTLDQFYNKKISYQDCLSIFGSDSDFLSCIRQCETNY